MIIQLSNYFDLQIKSNNHNFESRSKLQTFKQMYIKLYSIFVNTKNIHTFEIKWVYEVGRAAQSTSFYSYIRKWQPQATYPIAIV